MHLTTTDDIVQLGAYSANVAIMDVGDSEFTISQAIGY